MGGWPTSPAYPRRIYLKPKSETRGCPISRVLCEKWGLFQWSLVTDFCAAFLVLCGRAHRSQALLRQWRSALHYGQLLPSAATAGNHPPSRRVSSNSGKDSPALSIRGGGLRGHARALPSPDQRTREGQPIRSDAGTEAGIFKTSLSHFSQETGEVAHTTVIC